MAQNTGLVVTSIAPPNPVLHELARGCREEAIRFYVIGDAASPPDFHLDGCDFYSLERQAQQGFRFASLCPTRHYARKNIGYLIAAREGAEIIVETDDDNFPLPGFWARRERNPAAAEIRDAGWLNVYRYFTDARIWPRGLPLDAVSPELPPPSAMPPAPRDCPIQQALVDANPDVDAVYRLILPLPVYFQAAPAVALGVGTWCPFNSQNTAWWADAFPLLYLPAYCSFRVTDIWRSLIAQRIVWENNWSVLFHAPTVRQDRNEHNLMRDFADEVPGYLHNRKIGEVLERSCLRSGAGCIPENLARCYEALIAESFLDARELPLLLAWLDDLSRTRPTA